MTGKKADLVGFRPLTGIKASLTGGYYEWFDGDVLPFPTPYGD